MNDLKPTDVTALPCCVCCDREVCGSVMGVEEKSHFIYSGCLMQAYFRECDEAKKQDIVEYGMRENEILRGQIAVLKARLYGSL